MIIEIKSNPGHNSEILVILVLRRDSAFYIYRNFHLA
jgi:hypothetical protein